MTERGVTLGGELANPPLRPDRVVDPRLGPPVGDTGLDGAGRNFTAVAVEQRQFPAGLGQTALQIAPLRLGRPQRRRNIVIRFGTDHGVV